MGELPSTLPMFLIPQIPLTLETLMIIFPYSAAVAVVGLLESLLTASIVDDLTDTTSDKNQECIGQGIANTATGFIGGMAGCAMIGPASSSAGCGGRGRLSALPGWPCAVLRILGHGGLVRSTPTGAHVTTMIMAPIGSLSKCLPKKLVVHPRSGSTVMLSSV